MKMSEIMIEVDDVKRWNEELALKRVSWVPVQFNYQMSFPAIQFICVSKR